MLFRDLNQAVDLDDLPIFWPIFERYFFLKFRLRSGFSLWLYWLQRNWASHCCKTSKQIYFKSNSFFTKEHQFVAPATKKSSMITTGPEWQNFCLYSLFLYRSQSSRTCKSARISLSVDVLLLSYIEEEKCFSCRRRNTFKDNCRLSIIWKPIDESTIDKM